MNNIDCHLLVYGYDYYNIRKIFVRNITGISVEEVVYMERIPLMENIYFKLKDDIINLEYKQGVIILEKDLAEKYGVSKTPIREALNRLCLEGYMEKFPNKGYMVKGFTVNDLQNVFQYRSILEKAAVELAIEKATDQEIKALSEETNIITYDCGADVARLYNDFNHRFHLSIARLSKNPYLVEELENILNQTRRILLMDVRSYDISVLTKSHMDIVNSIEKRDKVTARELISNHIYEAQLRIYMKQTN